MITEQKMRFYLTYLAAGSLILLGGQNSGWAQENEGYNLEKPTLALDVNETLLWPPDDRMVDIIINTNVWDNRGTTTFNISAEVLSNEPEDDLEDDNTSIDWTNPVVDEETGAITLQLRAERSEEGNGRVYTIAVTATDLYNNSKTVFSNIFVPYEFAPYEFKESKTQAENTYTASSLTQQTYELLFLARKLSDLEYLIQAVLNARLALADKMEKLIGYPEEILAALRNRDKELEQKLKRLTIEHSAVKAQMEAYDKLKKPTKDSFKIGW